MISSPRPLVYPQEQVWRGNHFNPIKDWKKNFYFIGLNTFCNKWQFFCPRVTLADRTYSVINNNFNDNFDFQK